MVFLCLLAKPLTNKNKPKPGSLLTCLIDVQFWWELDLPEVPSIYHVSIIVDSFWPTHYVSKSTVLNVSKIGHFLDPPTHLHTHLPSQCFLWHNIRMVIGNLLNTPTLYCAAGNNNPYLEKFLPFCLYSKVKLLLSSKHGITTSDQNKSFKNYLKQKWKTLDKSVQ